MADVFAEDIATAQELITLYGESCQWQKPAAKTGGTPGYPTLGPVPDPVPCKIAWFSPRDLGRGTVEFLAALKGTEVPAGKQIGLLAGGISFEPEDVDTVVRRSGKQSAVESIDLLAPNGTPVLYFVTVAL